MLGADALDLAGQADALDGHVRRERDHPAAPDDQVAWFSGQCVDQTGQGGDEGKGNQ